MLAVILLLLSVTTLLAEAASNIVLHVTPVQYVSQGDTIQLMCEMNITVADSKISQEDNMPRITWYDGFIPIPAISNVYEINGCHLQQITVNITVTDSLQYGHYVCKVENDNGTVAMENTAVIPEGMQQEGLFSDITPEHPGVVMVSCSVSSSNVSWSILTIDHSEKISFHQGITFPYDLSSYKQSAKFVCHSESLLHSIIYVYPKDYDPVRFIYPQENTTLIFDNLDSKQIECRTIGSLKPNMSWVHGSSSKPVGNGVVRRVHVVNKSTSTPPYVLLLGLFSPVPYIDAGDYVCVVENEWEVVNRSITIKFELLSGDPFKVVTFTPIQYMFERGNFTSRCFIQVNEKNIYKVSVAFLHTKYSCNNFTSIQVITAAKSPKIKFVQNNQYINNEQWIIAELTVLNVTANDSGCYQCLAVSFGHTDRKSSDVIFLQTPFNITSYQSETMLIEKGSNVTLSCKIRVNKDYDMRLVYVFYRYYSTNVVAEYVRYNAEINASAIYKNITAKLTIQSADIQHSGVYECYARSLPPDHYIDPDDYFYEDSRSILLTVIGDNRTENNSNNDNIIITRNFTAKNNDTNTAGIIIGVVLGCCTVVLTMAVSILVIYAWRKRKANKKQVPTPLVATLHFGELKKGLVSFSSNPVFADFKKKFVDKTIDPNDLTILEQIGKGAFGKVYKGVYTKDTESVEVAIKTLRAFDVSKTEEFINECITTKKFDHPNVLNLIGISFIKGEGVPLMITPFMYNGDVKSYLKAKRGTVLDATEFPKGLNCGIVTGMCLDIAKGMEYLSSLRYVHRDLAARNCMLDENLVAKVADFGLTRDVYITDYYKMDHNTPLPVRWLAPEALIDKVFTSQSDVWSFGVTCWEIFTLGLQPYPAVDDYDIVKYLKDGKILDKPQLSSDEMYEIMTSCWNFMPESRPTFSLLIDQLTQQQL